MAYFLSIVYVLGNLILGMNVVALINQGLTFCCINIGTYYMDQMVGLYDKPSEERLNRFFPEDDLFSWFESADSNDTKIVFNELQ
eukprot:CAMPEP_0170839732 /NCGR_PEP_ID=MMETSP0734-20130129/4160_1 /TAXON_ID=186038 /ORGANISM="Fragilariopsis kerguelensis, Strain L26-C5" /LENGTH=84 /DNA_ID=CAMNT_0011207411 /DNA_START=754 /DNA_END=1009 /DNA_ORIENTATION=-